MNRLRETPDLAQNVAETLGRVRQAEQRAGRAPGSVKLIAVTKTVETSRVMEAVQAGVTAIGENYVQEAAGKHVELGEVSQAIEWHLIGHLQRNKAKLARQIFGWIETVDRVEIARELMRHSPEPLQALVQVRLEPGEQRAGVASDDLSGLLDNLLGVEGLVLRGLMGVPGVSEDPSEPRRSFERLRHLWEASRKQVGSDSDRVRWDTLSMGMSGDFELAIAEGATLVRVGSAIFGARPTR